MNKLYYNQNLIASKLITFFSILSLKLSKPNLKMLAFSIISLINSESVVTADLANSINSNQFSSNSESIQKRFWRFFNNKNVNIYDTYNSIINYIMSNINNVRLAYTATLLFITKGCQDWNSNRAGSRS